MGKIYFNEETGEFWESSFQRRKPPKGFKYTGYYMNYYFKPRTYVAKSYYCPECRKYHAIIKLYTREDEFPLWARKTIEIGSKYGCRIAEKIVKCAELIGGWEKHYSIALKIFEKGIDVEKWSKIICRVKGKTREKVIEKLLQGREKEAEIIAIAGRLR